MNKIVLCALLAIFAAVLAADAPGSFTRTHDELKIVWQHLDNLEAKLKTQLSEATSALQRKWQAYTDAQKVQKDAATAHQTAKDATAKANSDFTQKSEAEQKAQDVLRQEALKLKTAEEKVKLAQEALEAARAAYNVALDERKAQGALINNEIALIRKLKELIGDQHKCDDTFNTANNKCYKAVQKIVSALDARKECLTWGGDLVSIHSEGENKFVRGLCPSGKKIWIGLHDTKFEGKFEWFDGSDVSYKNWAPNEPNNLTDANNKDFAAGEDFVQMYEDGRWNDIPGVVLSQGSTDCFVCKK